MSQYKPPVYVAITAAMVCVLGVFYLVSEHLSGAMDATFHDAFVTMITLLTGSIVIARARSNGNGGGK